MSNDQRLLSLLIGSCEIAPPSICESSSRGHLPLLRLSEDLDRFPKLEEYRMQIGAVVEWRSPDWKFENRLWHRWVPCWKSGRPDFDPETVHSQVLVILVVPD